MNFAHDLFLLTFNLSQLHDKEKIIDIFTGGLTELFKPAVFHFLESRTTENNIQFEIRSKNTSFGFIEIRNPKSISAENKILINNAVQMLAVILERLEFDEILRKEKTAIEKIAKERQNELQSKIVELNEARSDSLELVADLKNEIKKRLKYEKELEESEEKFRILFENSTVGKSLTHLDSTIRVNQAFCNIVGYSEEELKNIKWIDITHPDDVELSNSIVKSLISGEIKVGRFEKRYIKKNNEIVWADVSTYLQKDQNGKPQFFITSTIDISDRKIAERELLHQRNLMQYIIEHTKSAIAVHDRDLHYIYVSKVYLQQYGIKDENIVGKHHYEVFPDLPQKWRDVHQRVLNGETISSEKDSYERDSGTVEWTRWECRPWYENNGSIGGLIVYTEVITERVKAEEELRKLSSRNEALLESVPDIIMEVDNNKKYTWANKAGKDFFGEDVIGKEASFYFEGEQDTYETVKSLFNGKTVDIIYVESWQRRIDGEKRLLAWWCRVLKDEDQNVTGVLSTARDITERKISEEALIKSEERFRLLAESAPIGIVISDHEQKTIYVSKRFVQLFGYTIEDMPSVEEWLTLAYPDEGLREQIKIKWNETIKIAQKLKTEIEPLEFPVTCKDGNVRQIEFRIASTGDLNFVIFNDVTERKIAEDNLERLKNNLEIEVKQKTKELQQRIVELERFHDATVDREIRMKELRNEINRLKSGSK